MINAWRALAREVLATEPRALELAIVGWAIGYGLCVLAALYCSFIK